jgi:hypothetical protein
VLADRGLWARWLFGRIVRLGWHPLLRINNGAKFRPAVAYLRYADKYCGPLLCRLKGVNQSVIRSHSVFSTPRASLLADI